MPTGRESGAAGGVGPGRHSCSLRHLLPHPPPPDHSQPLTHKSGDMCFVLFEFST